MESKFRRRVSIILILVMIISLITPHTSIFAASGPKLSSKKANIVIGKTKTIRVKCRVPGSISVKSLNPSFCDVVKVKNKLKKKKPASFTLKALSTGYAIISIHVKLKKKIKNKREFDLRFHAYLVDKPSPDPSAKATPTLSPGASGKPASTPTRSPAATATPTATPSAKPTSSAKTSATPTATATAIVTPVPTPDPYNYTVTYTHNLSGDKVVTGMPDPLVVKIPKDGDCKLTLPAAPRCDGYYLDSWIYKNDYRKNPGDIVTVDKDMTIKARFVRDRNVCIVQYETGAQQHPEIRGVINGTTVEYGGTLTISSIRPSWSGHSFSGWRMSGYDTVYQPGDTINNIHSDFTLYAVWDEDVSSLPSATPPAREAEANDGVVHWNTKLPRSTSIGHIDCRW